MIKTKKKKLKLIDIESAQTQNKNYENPWKFNLMDKNYLWNKKKHFTNKNDLKYLFD